MLSATYTITDIKTKLRNDYAFFGFATDNAFIAALTDCVDIVKYDDMLPYLSKSSVNFPESQTLMVTGIYSGEAYYNYIASKNKVGLLLGEQYIYKAEIWFACANFIGTMSDDCIFSMNGGSISESTKGYSYSVSDIKNSGKQEIVKQYYEKAITSLKSAGIDTNSLYRGGR